MSKSRSRSTNNSPSSSMQKPPIMAESISFITPMSTKNVSNLNMKQMAHIPSTQAINRLAQRVQVSPLPLPPMIERQTLEKANEYEVKHGIPMDFTKYSQIKTPNTEAQNIDTAFEEKTQKKQIPKKHHEEKKTNPSSITENQAFKETQESGDDNENDTDRSLNDPLKELITMKQKELAHMHAIRQRTLDATVQELTQENDELRSKYVQLQEDFAYNLNLLKERDDELADFEREAQTMQKMLEEKKNEAQKVKLNLAKYESAAKREAAVALEAQAAANRELDKRVQAFERLQKENEYDKQTMRDRHEAARREWQRLSAEKDNEHAGMIAKLEAQFDDWSRRLTDESIASLNELRTANETLQKQQETLHNELLKERAEKSNVHSQLQENRSIVRKLEQQLVEFREKSVHDVARTDRLLQSANAQHQETLTEYENRLSDTVMQLHSLESLLSEEKRSHASIIEQMEVLHHESEERWQARCNALEANKVQLLESIDTKDTTIIKLQQDLNKAKLEAEAAQGRLQAESDTMVQDIATKLREAETQVFDRDRELVIMREKLASQKTSLQEKRDETISLKEKLKLAEEKADVAYRQQIAIQHQAENDAEVKDKIISDLKSQLHDAVAQKRSIMDERDVLNNAYSHANDRISDYQRQLAAVRTELLNLRHEFNHATVTSSATSRQQKQLDIANPSKLEDISFSLQNGSVRDSRASKKSHSKSMRLAEPINVTQRSKSWSEAEFSQREFIEPEPLRVESGRQFESLENIVSSDSSKTESMPAKAVSFRNTMPASLISAHKSRGSIQQVPEPVPISLTQQTRSGTPVLVEQDKNDFFNTRIQSLSQLSTPKLQAVLVNNESVPMLSTGHQHNLSAVMESRSEYMAHTRMHSALYDSDVSHSKPELLDDHNQAKVAAPSGLGSGPREATAASEPLEGRNNHSIYALMSENEQLRAQNTRIQQVVSQMRTEMNDLLRDQSTPDAFQLHQRLEHAKQINNDLQGRIAKLDQHNRLLSSKVEAVIHEADLNKNSNSQLLLVDDDEVKFLRGYVNELHVTISNIRAEMNDYMIQQQSQSSSQLSKIELLQSNMQQLEQELGDAHSQMAHMEKELLRAQRKRAETEQRVHDQKIDLQTAKESLKRLRAEREKLIEVSNELRAELARSMTVSLDRDRQTAAASNTIPNEILLVKRHSHNLDNMPSGDEQYERLLLRRDGTASPAQREDKTAVLRQKSDNAANTLNDDDNMHDLPVEELKRAADELIERAERMTSGKNGRSRIHETSNIDVTGHHIGRPRPFAVAMSERSTAGQIRALDKLKQKQKSGNRKKSVERMLSGRYKQFERMRSEV